MEPLRAARMDSRVPQPHANGSERDCPELPIRFCCWETSYPRGGGESGVENDSSGSKATSRVQDVSFASATKDVEGASTAAGPISEAAIAASGSEVLRHEHE